MKYYLYHGNNQIYIEYPKNINIGSISISYSGKMAAESMLPDGWVTMGNTNKIICANIGQNNPEFLFYYLGKITIHSASIIEKNLNIHSLIIRVIDIDTWDKIDSMFNLSNLTYDSLNKIHSEDVKINNTSITTNDLISKLNEFYYENGNPYEGKYHQHMNGATMTGERHTILSQYIFRKDSNGKLLKITVSGKKPSSLQRKGNQKSVEMILHGLKDSHHASKNTFGGYDRLSEETLGPKGGGGSGGSY